MQNVLIIGLGKLGSALFRFLKEERNINVNVVDKTPFAESWQKFLPASRYFNRLSPEIMQRANGIFICVPDDQIPTVVHELLAFELKDKFVAHTSGLVLAKVLSPLAKQGALVGSLHPLQTFPERFLPPGIWRSITCTFQGDLRLLTLLRALFAGSKMNFIQVSGEQKMAVHLAAVVAANYQVALYAWAQQILAEAGLKDLTASQLLGPLAFSVAQNFNEKPLHAILSGPLQRGDLMTIREHLKLLEKQGDALSVALYKALGLKLLQNSEFSIANREELLRLFNGQK